MPRTMTYAEAIREATEQIMDKDANVILFGLDVDDPKRIQGTTKGLLEKFGAGRVFGTPLAEDAMTGIAVGMARAGLRPIHNHIRFDFVLLAMNQLINVAAKTRYMTGGAEHVPMVARIMVGKSWGQGAQHSQALHSMFMHIPGLKVVAPTTPYDAKACLASAVWDDDPVIYVEHRLLHFQKGVVPEELITSSGKARVAVEGSDITLVGISYMQVECLRAQKYLEDLGIHAEVIDPIWLQPLDIDTILKSTEKTHRLLVVDNAWTTCGASAEIIARVAEAPGQAMFNLSRMGFAPTTCPPSPTLEDAFYPNAISITRRVCQLLDVEKRALIVPRDDLKEIEFKGPF